MDQKLQTQLLMTQPVVQLTHAQPRPSMEPLPQVVEQVAYEPVAPMETTQLSFFDAEREEEELEQSRNKEAYMEMLRAAAEAEEARQRHIDMQQEHEKQRQLQQHPPRQRLALQQAQLQRGQWQRATGSTAQPQLQHMTSGDLAARQVWRVEHQGRSARRMLSVAARP